MQTINIK